MGFEVQRGDILLYRKPPTFFTRLIEFGESLEDEGEDKYFYHVALALSDSRKIEADMLKVSERDIDFSESCEVYRPIGDVEPTIPLVTSHIGEMYSLLADVDDGLSYLTQGKFHLPAQIEGLIAQHMVNCSQLLQPYVTFLYHTPGKAYFTSPEDIYQQVKSTYRGDFSDLEWKNGRLCRAVDFR